MDVVNLVLQYAKGPNPKVLVRADAFGYVIGVLDEWILQARVFYLVSGVLEATLRARLNAHLTDLLGPDWPSKPGAAPSGLNELTKRAKRDEALLRVRALVESANAHALTLTEHQKLLADLNSALEPPGPEAPKNGSDFLRDMTFAGLRMFFERKEGWQGKQQLQDIFRVNNPAAPPTRDRVLLVLKKLNEARNDLAHYRPVSFPTFEQPLFDAAELASWFGQDIQHIYSSIDRRSSTELSVLLGPLGEEMGQWSTRIPADRCEIGTCVTHPPLDWLMDRAPRERSDIAAVSVRRACLYHRVSFRHDQHSARPAGQ